MNTGVKRILTAVVGIPLVLLPMYTGGIWFLLLVAVIVVAGQYELYRMQPTRPSSVHLVLGLSAGLLLVLRSELAWSFPVVVVLFVLLFLNMVREGPGDRLVADTGVALIAGLAIFPVVFACMWHCR